MARKTYKQKYKSKREDFRKGGRVKAARGFAGEPVEPIERKKPIVRKPIQPAPKKPVQPGIPVTGTGNIKTGTPATPRDLPPGTTGSPTLPGVKIDPTLPSRGRPRPPSIGGVGGGRMMTGREELGLANESLRSDTVQPRMTNDLPKFIPGQTSTRRGAGPTPPEGKLKQVDSSGNILKDTLIGRQPGETVEQYRARTAGQFTPNPNQQTGATPEEIAALKGGGSQIRPNVSNDSDRFLRNKATLAKNITGSFGKGSDQMFIGREGDVRPQAQTTNRRRQLQDLGYDEADIRDILERDEIRERERDERDERDTGPSVGDTRTLPNGMVLVWTGSSWVPQTPPGETPPGETPPPVDETETPLTAKQRAEQLIQQDTTIAPPREVEVGELGVAKTMAEREAIEAATAEVGAAPEAKLMKDIATAQTPEQIETATFDAFTVNQSPEVVAAIQELTPEVKARITAKVQEGAITSPATAAQVAKEEIEAALAPEVRGQLRDISQVAELAPRERIEMEEVPEAEVTTRTAEIISEKQKTDILSNVTGEGVNLEDIPQFNVVGQRTAQVAEANTRIAQELGTAPSMDATERAAITSDGIAKGDAAQIGGVPTLEAASRQAVTGEARKTAAADMLAVVGEMPPEVTAAIVEDPATVEAQLDTAPVNVQAAVAALPKEALVSTQMEGLLAGIEENKTPAWARPAVDAVNAMLARRGMSASTVGRDALFNAIIQSALPIAQSNAQALQQRASQNLSNEQQANLQQANQVMQQRMTNLANRQTAASQTAQMAQQVVLKQGEFEQQAVLTTAQQEQQVRMQNIQNEQQKASQESAQRQQVAIANLDTATKIDLANLEMLNAAGRENLSAEQQTRLTQFQAKVDRNARQAELNQRMEEVNLSNELKVELANLTELNAASRENMSAEQQARLTNLNVLVDFKKTNASLAQQMDLANMSAENQMELANLQERAAADSANFTEANKFRLQELTTAASVLSQNAELKQRAEFAKLSAEEKITLANLTAKNQADSENMTAANQVELANLNKKMRVAEVNANLAQQLGLAELSAEQERAMTNAQINANMDMANFNAEQQTALANSKFMQTATLTNLNNKQQAAMQNATAMASMDLANLSTRERLAVENARNFLQMDMANLSNQQQANMLTAQQEQQRLLSNQSAENAARQFNSASENQTNQFMASLAAQVDQFNTAQINTSKQFNAQQQNARDALEFQVEADLEKANAAMVNQVNQFNEQTAFERDKFNTANAQAIEQANLAWRRQANTINTAAANQVNMQNAMNSFNLSSQALGFLWQEMRDQANYTWQSSENEENRKAQLYAQALANEGGSAKDWKNNISSIGTLISTIFGSK